MSKILTLKKIFLFIGDIFLLYISLLMTLFFSYFGEFNYQVFAMHVIPFSIVYLIWLVIFYIAGLYDLHVIKTRTSFYARITAAMLVGLGLGMIFFYALPIFGITPKTNLLLNGLIFGLLFWGWRNLFHALFSVRFLNRTAVIGKGPYIEELKREIDKMPYLGYKIVEVDQKKDLLPQIQKKSIDTVIFPEDLESDPKILKALYFCLPAQVTFLDFAKAYEIINQKIPVSRISHSWFLENMREGEKGFYDKIKRFIDVFLAVIISIITLPLWPLIALAVKLGDGGPVLYAQERIGKDRQPFTLYKFRSMKVGAEKNGAVWAKKNDSRVTVVGNFLRKSHLDELPQMINVLKGDISIVGPRPERAEFVEKLEKQIPHYYLRHIIKPGFTGWAQIKFRYGRSVMDSKEKFEYDLYYIKNRDFILDFSILLKTFRLFFEAE